MVKGETYPQEVLSREEVAALLAQCSHRSPTGIRNRALLALLHRTGLRIAEALALRPADVDPATGTVTVMRGKGHKRRVVGIPGDAQADVLRWLDCRKHRGLSGHSLLFCTLRGKPMSGQYVRGLLQRLARDAGVDRRVTPHSLRHTWAVELAREGVPMTAIQHGLGHSRLTTTVRHVDHLQPGELIALTRDRPGCRFAWPKRTEHLGQRPGCRRRATASRGAARLTTSIVAPPTGSASPLHRLSRCG